MLLNFGVDRTDEDPLGEGESGGFQQPEVHVGGVESDREERKGESKQPRDGQRGVNTAC